MEASRALWGGGSRQPGIGRSRDSVCRSRMTHGLALQACIVYIGGLMKNGYKIKGTEARTMEGGCWARAAVVHRSHLYSPPPP